jgi:hypothetical protein
MTNMKRQHSISDEQRERLGRELIKAFAATDEEVAQTADAPFMFRRIQARIAAEERERAEAGNLWLALSARLRRALPVFAALAVFTIGGAMFAAKPDAAPRQANNSFDNLVLEDNEDLISAQFAPQANAPFEEIRK